MKKMDIEEAIETNPLLLVDFYAEWCEPCKWLDEILKEVAENLPEGVGILKIDVDKELVIASRYHVKSVPTLVLFKKGIPVWRMAGFKMAPELTEIIKSHF